MTSFIDLWHTVLEDVTGMEGSSSDLYKEFLKERLGEPSPNSTVADMENLWLANETGLEGGNKYLWRKYLEAKGYAGAVPDMKFAAAKANNLLKDAGTFVSYILLNPTAGVGDEDYLMADGDKLIQ